MNAHAALMEGAYSVRVLATSTVEQGKVPQECYDVYHVDHRPSQSRVELSEGLMRSISPQMQTRMESAEAPNILQIQKHAGKVVRIPSAL
jgi:hypothetical protein